MPTSRPQAAAAVGVDAWPMMAAQNGITNTMAMSRARCAAATSATFAAAFRRRRTRTTRRTPTNKARGMSTIIGVPSCRCRPITPSAADTASVNRSRGHAKMRAKPVGARWAADAMDRTIEHGGGAALPRDAGHVPPAVVRPYPAWLGAPCPRAVAFAPARVAAQSYSRLSRTFAGAGDETKKQDSGRRGERFWPWVLRR